MEWVFKLNNVIGRIMKENKRFQFESSYYCLFNPLEENIKSIKGVQKKNYVGALVQFVLMCASWYPTDLEV